MIRTAPVIFITLAALGALVAAQKQPVGRELQQQQQLRGQQFRFSKHSKQGVRAGGTCDTAKWTFFPSCGTADLKTDCCKAFTLVNGIFRKCIPLKGKGALGSKDCWPTALGGLAKKKCVSTEFTGMQTDNKCLAANTGGTFVLDGTALTMAECDEIKAEKPLYKIDENGATKTADRYVCKKGAALNSDKESKELPRAIKGENKGVLLCGSSKTGYKWGLGVKSGDKDEIQLQDAATLPGVCSESTVVMVTAVQRKIQELRPDGCAGKAKEACVSEGCTEELSYERKCGWNNHTSTCATKTSTSLKCSNDPCAFLLPAESKDKKPQGAISDQETCERIGCWVYETVISPEDPSEMVPKDAPASEGPGRKCAWSSTATSTGASGSCRFSKAKTHNCSTVPPDAMKPCYYLKPLKPQAKPGQVPEGKIKDQATCLQAGCTKDAPSTNGDRICEWKADSGTCVEATGSSKCGDAPASTEQPPAGQRSGGSTPPGVGAQQQTTTTTTEQKVKAPGGAKE